ncbi:MAG: deoxynucleoside kinase [Saprospiraceae bacterium]|nr:deoxynucleoside kinase [Saprospiraceae bacterium]
MNTFFPYNFIAIEGNIGAGKSTLSKMIAKDFGGRLVLERFDDNPFLPYFYENPERYAFPVELFFMTERHKQLQEEIAQQSLFEQFIVSDYFFLKTLLFAKNNLKEEEYRLFQRLFYILNASFPKPELLVYLHRSVPQLLENIQKRGRHFEKDISAEYLLQIQHTYFDFFKLEQSLPILILEIESIDFQSNKNYYFQLIELLKQQYKPGIQTIRIK